MPRIAYGRGKEPRFLTVHQVVNHFVLEACSSGFQPVWNTHLVIVLASLSYYFRCLQPQYLWAGEYFNFMKIISINPHSNCSTLIRPSSTFLRGGNWELDCWSKFPKVMEHLCIGAVICTQEPHSLKHYARVKLSVNLFHRKKTRKMYRLGMFEFLGSLF